MPFSYVCANCGYKFVEPYEKHTTYEEYNGVSSMFHSHTPLTVYLCPHCSSDDIEEAYSYADEDEEE